MAWTDDVLMCYVCVLCQFSHVSVHEASEVGRGRQASRRATGTLHDSIMITRIMTTHIDPYLSFQAMTKQCITGLPRCKDEG